MHGNLALIKSVRMLEIHMQRDLINLFMEKIINSMINT